MLINHISKGILIVLLLVMSLKINAQNKETGNSALSAHEENIAIISSLTAVGDLDKLAIQLNAGLNAGITIEQTKEILVQLYAYCGFPRSLNALAKLMEVVEKRKAEGISDIREPAIPSKKVNRDKYEQGRKVLELLTKTPQSKPAPGFGGFAPRIDKFLKEHLFADIFESDVLSYRQREIVTISALTAMQGVTSQLQAHVKMGRNVGITEDQLTAIASISEKFVNRTQANSLREIIEKPLPPITSTDMMVRISEIEIFPEFLIEYNKILKEEAAASVLKEPGVLSIFPMQMKNQQTEIRIIEIYADSAAYQSHLKTPHFQHYKTSTKNMVKSLKLVDMNALDPASMIAIFEKLK